MTRGCRTLGPDVLAAPDAPDVPVAPGDDRRGYASPDYQTRSRHVLAAPAGGPAAAVDPASPPLGLPPLAVPPDNAPTPARVELGRRLFLDRRLSLNRTMSCAMCHVPEQAFAHNEMRVAVGIEGRRVRRNAPTLLNAAYHERLFHDGREIALENQVWSPLLAANEMANPSVGFVIETLRGLEDYEGLFEDAYGRGPFMETVGGALASYQRTLLSGDSPFDRWRYGGEADALTAAARRGFELFTGKAGCGACHLVGPEWTLFTDDQFHNTGIGVARTRRTTTGTATVPLAPGETLTVDTSGFDHLGRLPPPDLGRYEVTLRPEDRWAFRTPTLRNVALTAPYMHDGSLPTLADVVRFYDGGGFPNEDLDPLIRPLALSADERADLVAFLDSLTGSNVAALIADARSTPVGD
jgi:cytochrome c peroxidase